MSRVRELCAWKGYDEELSRIVEVVIATLDSAYLEWARESAPSKGKGPEPPPKPEGGWSGRKRRRG